jgi:hypothetical protein
MTIGLTHIQTIFFPADLVDELYETLRQTGDEGFERLALCAGEKKQDAFSVTHVLYPQQYLRKTPLGLSFHVEGEELERIGNWLFEKQLSLIAQVHTHPQEAYHSEADDEHCIITRTGGLSIVVPYFGRTDRRFSESAVYRLTPEGWAELDRSAIDHLIKIME